MNESTNQSRMVSGLFNDKESAERAYQSLVARGYTSEEANVIMSDDTRNKYYPAGTELWTTCAALSATGKSTSSAHHTAREQRRNI